MLVKNIIADGILKLALCMVMQQGLYNLISVSKMCEVRGLAWKHTSKEINMVTRAATI